MENNFLIGGKLGDFIHLLYVVKNKLNGEKSNVYLIDYKFDDYEKTFNDIYPIVIKQPYIKNFILKKDDDYTGLIDLRSWRYDYDLLYRVNWYDLLHNEYKLDKKYSNEQWLYDDTKNEKYKDKILIHYSIDRQNKFHMSILNNIIKNNDCLFVSCDPLEYEYFPFKKDIEYKNCSSFSELFYDISSCKFFVGNQSMPLAISHALFKNHLGLLFDLDAPMYMDDFNKNYFWLNNQKFSDNFNRITDFIKLNYSI